MKSKYNEPNFIKHCKISQEDIYFFKADLEDVFSKFSLKPFGTVRINWRDQDNLKQYNIDENNLTSVIDNFLSNKDEMVHIYLDDGTMYDIKIKAKQLRKCLKYIEDETFSYWIVSSNYKWIIELYNGTEVVIKENE